MYRHIKRHIVFERCLLLNGHKRFWVIWIEWPTAENITYLSTNSEELMRKSAANIVVFLCELPTALCKRRDFKSALLTIVFGDMIMIKMWNGATCYLLNSFWKTMNVLGNFKRVPFKSETPRCKSRDVSLKLRHFLSTMWFFWTGQWEVAAGCARLNGPIRALLGWNLKVYSALQTEQNRLVTR